MPKSADYGPGALASDRLRGIRLILILNSRSASRIALGEGSDTS